MLSGLQLARSHLEVDVGRPRRDVGRELAADRVAHRARRLPGQVGVDRASRQRYPHAADEAGVLGVTWSGAIRLARGEAGGVVPVRGGLVLDLKVLDPTGD